MKSVRKTIAYLLVVTLPLSAWAGIGAPCTQNSASESAAQAVMVDTHAHHDAAQSAEDGSTGMSTGQPASHHGGADANADPSQAECPCCDDCETTCVLSSCSPVALGTTSGLVAFSVADKHLPSADAFRNGPPPHVLFRPPILTV